MRRRSPTVVLLQRARGLRVGGLLEIVAMQDFDLGELRLTLAPQLGDARAGRVVESVLIRRFDPFAGKAFERQFIG